jgi:hypothetical protein
MQLQSTLTCPKCSYQARRCRSMPASSSMPARAVANGSSPSRAIAACSALTVQCRARRHRATCVAACQRFNKCSEALNARSAIQWKIKRSRPIAAPDTGSQCFHQLALGCDARQVCGHRAGRAGADAQWSRLKKAAISKASIISALLLTVGIRFRFRWLRAAHRIRCGERILKALVQLVVHVLVGFLRLLGICRVLIRRRGVEFLGHDILHRI